MLPLAAVSATTRELDPEANGRSTVTVLHIDHDEVPGNVTFTGADPLTLTARTAVPAAAA